MTTLKDVVGFRRDLYFGGAVQIDWFETDEQKRDQAAANFVFHGPEYFGVTEDDKEGAKAYSLIDTVSLTSELLDAIQPGRTDAFPIALAIAGYGAGKSHYALTLARLLCAPSEVTPGVILDNIESASPKLGGKIRRQVEDWDRPVLVLPINGMNDFNLSEELSRQALVQLRARGLDTTPVEELWPRFQEAEEFVRRNFDRWETEFRKVFGKKTKLEEILAKLGAHSEAWFQKVNEIYEDATGRPIRVSGAESANQLISTLCREYCGENGPFQSVLILFDEFGRYLEFAIERPHVAGDAALQQVFEGVQDNAEKCFMLCTIQYELKAYISRVSPEKQNVIQRYVGRYDAAKKYYLSSNLETLFAHLIEKKAPEFIEDHLFSGQLEKQWKSIHASISTWFPATQKDSVWREAEPFFQTIVEGCWPLHPLTTLFLTRLGSQLQQRSAVTFIDSLIQRESGRALGKKKGAGWTLPANALFQPEKGLDDPLLKEFLSAETFGGTAQSYSAVEEKYQHDLADNERATLQAILIADKMGLKAADRESYHQALTFLCGLTSKAIQTAVEELEKEYGVLEWSDRFVRYEVISEGIPRSRFTTFLARKVRGVDPKNIEEFFALYLWKWADLSSYREIDPEFASQHAIRTSEWRYKGILTNRDRIDQDLSQAVKDWETAVEPDNPRGQLLYCYVSADANIEEIQHRISKKLEASLPRPEVPVAVVLIHDKENRMRGILAEQWVLKDGLTKEEKGTYQNFIEDQQNRLQAELQGEFLASLKEKNFVLPQSFSGKSGTIEHVCLGLFEETYPKIVGFPFDGFGTVRGQAAKDCYDLTLKLFQGDINYEWISLANPKIQNRARSVLINGWGVIKEDDAIGKIAHYPKHEELKNLTLEFEKKLEEKKSINLGDIARRLIHPPYGMNIASAGLFLGVFFSPRKDSMVIIRNGENLSWSHWLKEAISKRFFDLKVLDKTEVEQVDTNEWEQLLERWDAAASHIERVGFLERAINLNRQIPISSDLLLEKRKNLQRISEESRNKINELDDFIENEWKFLNIATEREKVENISRVGKEAINRQKKMESEIVAWTEDQIDEVKRIVDTAKAAVLTKFEDWLRGQSCISYARVDSFRDLMVRKTGSNLKALGMNDLARRVEDRTNQIIADMETRNQISYSVQEAESFLVGKTTSDQTKVSLLAQWIKDCDDHEKNLEKARKIKDVPEIDQTIQKVRQFQTDCKKQRKTHRDRMDTFFERKFQSFSDIQEGREEVRALMGIFAGSAFDLEELETMQKRLEMVERDFAALDDLSKPDSEIRAIFDERMETARTWEEEDEQDWPQVYENIFHHVIKKREDLSKDWLDGVLKSPKEIAGMDAEKCQQLRSRLEAAPSYMTESDRKNVDEMKTAIQKRFEDLKVEGLLAQFRRLPQNLRREFFEIISAEVG